VQLFTPARHEALHCDAYLIDTDRRVRPLVLDALTPLEPIVDAVLDRVLLMSRSLHSVRHKTFGLFFTWREGQFVLGPAYPFYASIFGDLQETLEKFGQVRTGEDEDLRDEELQPLLAYVDGQVSFFDSPTTRPWLKLAGRRGLRIVVPAPAHAAGEDVVVDGVSVAEYLQAPEEESLDLDVTDELPTGELEQLLREHRPDPQ
jgi:hypothetical protein